MQDSGQVYITAVGKLPFHPHMLTEGLRFLGACLSHSAGVTTQQALLATSLPVIANYIANTAKSSELAQLQRDKI